MKQKKETRVTIRLTAEQYESICARAETAHMTPSAYVRAAAMRHKVVVIDGLKEFTHELKGMGCKKLSMDELMERNRPAHMTLNAQTESAPPPQEATPNIVIQCPMQESLDRLECQIQYLERSSSSQAEYLKQLTEMRGWLPTRMQMDELLKRMMHLEQMLEQAGKPKERSFSLPGIRLPKLRLPHLDGPTWISLLMVLAVLLLLWWGLGGIWSNLSQLFR